MSRKKKNKMKRIIFTILIGIIITPMSYGQFTTDEVTYGNRINLENSNSWAIGAGVSNFIMHGDLRSIGSGDDTNYFNLGGFVYVDKMFNPLLGLELKGFYTKMSGGAQYFSTTEDYRILYAGSALLKDEIYFEGAAYGAELNLIFSFTNLYKTKNTKWNAAGYFGVGYQQYDSRLYERDLTGTLPDNLLVDFGKNPARDGNDLASSIYLSAQLGIKRRLSKRLDLEFRTGIYFNYEDHLDATISNKQVWETFFVSSVGLAFKLGKKKVYSIWNEQNSDANSFKIIDTDKDGVMDELDIEPNTPAGIMVYGNGKAVDADKDGIPDHKDKCPLEYGSLENEGCPTLIDSDGDGVLDDSDLCPSTVGPIENKGCPEQEAAKPENINQQIAVLATSIYFDTNSDRLKNISYTNIDNIIRLMKKIPNAKFIIEGHTDNRNSDRFNLLLSQKRAEQVRKYMIKSGIDIKRLQAKGYGESRPKFSNENAGGRQLNRRVEIIATDEFFN